MTVSQRTNISYDNRFSIIYSIEYKWGYRGGFSSVEAALNYIDNDFLVETNAANAKFYWYQVVETKADGNKNY